MNTNKMSSFEKFKTFNLDTVIGGVTYNPRHTTFGSGAPDFEVVTNYANMEEATADGCSTLSCFDSGVIIVPPVIR